MENPNYKNENIETKYLSNMRKNQLLKIKNSLLEFEKYFIELRIKRIKRIIKELFFKMIIVSIDDMDKLEEKEMKK